MDKTGLETRSPDSPVTPSQPQAVRPRGLSAELPASTASLILAQVPEAQRDRCEAEAGADILVGLRGGASLSSGNSPLSDNSQPSAMSPALPPYDPDFDEEDLPAAKRPRVGSAQRRSYTWRCQMDALDARDDTNPKQLIQQANWQRPQALTNSSARPRPMVSSAAQKTGTSCLAGPENKEADREWAALTTWLRMNLHHPRTAKKAVLFVGEYDTDAERWFFSLNEVFKWDDLSPETKTRLRSLPTQAEKAFTQKYPRRLPSEWRQKTQKYKKEDEDRCYQVPLGHLVDQLHQIYLEQTQVQRGARILEHNWRRSTQLGSQPQPAPRMSLDNDAYPD